MSVKEQFKNFGELLRGRNLYYLLGGGLLLLGILDYFFLLSPQIKTLTKVRAEKAVLRENVQRAQQDLIQLNRYRQQLKTLRRDIDRLNARVHAKTDVPLILEYISGVANQYQVKIRQMMPDVQNMDVVLEEGGKRYLALPIVIEARAGYHAFGRFLNAVEEGDLVLRVRRFSILERTGKKTHNIKLTLRVIVIDEV